VAALVRLNGLKNPNVLLIGQKLRVPCAIAKPPVIVVPPPPPPPTDGACIWHTVQRGDTLFKLAVKYNTTVAAIAERNKIKNPNLIFVGQQLCIVDP
jgi:LysM repeat protein